MLLPKRITSPDISTKQILFSGGLNEAVSNLEMRPGELSECINYEELEGLTHGYKSASGYERYDGTQLASDVSLILDEDGNVIDDTAREARRAAISAVPGEGPIWGLKVYNGNLYAIRNSVGLVDANMYVASATGWTLITNISSPITQQVDFEIQRFSLYNGNKEVLLWADGSNDIAVYDGTTVVNISLPVAATYGHILGAWKNRLFVAAPDGHIFFSAIGDPTDFSTASITGEIFIGEDITAIQEAPGGVLVIATKNSIKILYYESTNADFIFRMEEFSNTSGMITSTNQRMLGTVYFADDRGITTMEAADTYGDFSANTLAKKVQKTFQVYKNNIIGSTTDRERNQYQLFLSGGKGTLVLVFTFSGKRLRGTTLLEYPHIMTSTTTGKDSFNEDISYLGSADGHVYKRNSGTSFDGIEIETRLATPFHSYNTPTRWKDFKNILFELSADSGVEILYRTEFDYLSSSFPVTSPSAIQTDSGGGVWGRDDWGSFIWGAAYLTQLSSRMIGFGTNMRLLLSTTSKYKEPHTFHNFIVEYVIGSRKL